MASNNHFNSDTSSDQDGVPSRKVKFEEWMGSDIESDKG